MQPKRPLHRQVALRLGQMFVCALTVHAPNHIRYLRHIQAQVCVTPDTTACRRALAAQPCGSTGKLMHML